ncbi:MAG: cyclase family protein [Acidobacteria bacterium]|nr:MAG: cyclase family protein [Acidobacteriota bacterium]
MKIFDISHTIRSDMAVWPGDTPFSRTLTAKMEEGDAYSSSAVTMSLHAGTHLDAPAHYLPGACTVDKLDLAVLVGPAELMTVRPAHASGVRARDLEKCLAARPPRLLIRANPLTDLTEFPYSFVPLTGEAAEAIVAAGVAVLGIDSPSVDPFGSPSLPVHQTLGKRGVIILENLCFQDIPDGRYTLVALPLKIEAGDGSPVRAVLIEE